MAREHPLPPSAASLSASMRDLGYSLETAVADLIDNSISAGANEIKIFCDLSGDTPILCIIDNGCGMVEDDLIAAMRHGTANPKLPRKATDLGRFGLGLKTASFSQCRSLTVVSSRDSAICGAEWNLDLIDNRDDWLLNILDQEEIRALPYVDHLPSTGTIVLWRELDRLFEDETGTKRDEIVNEKLDVLERHLSLVFHRFLAGEIKGRKISIFVNGHPVEEFDPFCRKNSATQLLPEEIVHVGGAVVTMQPYILPHHSRLSPSEYLFYQNRSDFISNQGAYIYRGGRLMAWGDWFRLVPKGEATKLARVRIDFPNALDESWTIDIKKSRARPPHAVRERLRQIIAKITDRSTTVHRGRGQKLFQEVEAPLWERYADSGGIRFEVNREHPLVLSLRSKLDDAGERQLLMLVESIGHALPVEMIYSDYSLHPKEFGSGAVEKEELIRRLEALRVVLYGPEGGNSAGFRDVAKSIRIFENRADILENYISEHFYE
ncbi:MAG TPA: ATP-binding protein [Thalassospira sp.]|jgi:hypothetical protein|uniref:ATP-binding protein n=1 Tax=Thalassospira xiamenensis TaxID=220697 RepID=UPI000E808419|nr:ATP-binding protein [Thalassospira xiamenensis]HBN51288.1 ATP-binding protein [Thalassospira sp.]|tara:strand:- start:468 stop:1946 length:1479 start_codon:yes stop_codon:yes gene_type:complete